ncbi:MAG TPA: UDP-3-O-(3-hydroxymyristoyl)glucosamine N-acyltransferase [Candidatus Methylacidiphilales bacterium]|nr:UDP-3-O-(3-hydroxymyristoyl)glucosamine N-acyltransferase [Candidatus Methylacidiphilales bacterium]
MNSPHTVRSITDHVNGTLLGEGADAVVVTGINDLRSAGPSQISFLGNAKYEALARQSKAAAILVTARDAPRFTFTRIVVDSPSHAFAKISELFAPPPICDEPSIHPTAVISPDVTIGEGVGIGPHAVISSGVRLGPGAVIGANCFIGQEAVIGGKTRLYPLVTIRERCILGARVIIHSGAVIGADGFGYDFDPVTGRHVKIAHTGYVQIDDDAEIGANTTIDRGRFGRTHIGEGVKIDNLVMIAHNVTIGAHSIIVAQAGVSGSTSLGRYVTLAGQAGLAGHLNVGDRATITAQSGISKDVPAGAVLAGRHAAPIRESLKLEALVRRLPELAERLKMLEEKIKSLP